jgi:hypothetical protein
MDHFGSALSRQSPCRSTRAILHSPQLGLGLSLPNEISLSQRRTTGERGKYWWPTARRQELSRHRLKQFKPLNHRAVMRMETQMFTTKQFRAKSTEYSNLIKGSNNPSQIGKFQDLKGSFNALADNEEWLANNFDKMVNAPGEEQPSHTGLAVEEERVLRYLGAALIMQWNTLPAKLQRELFDTAGSMGELLDTAVLRGQIARFLHKHKDGGSEA